MNVETLVSEYNAEIGLRLEDFEEPFVFLGTFPRDSFVAFLAILAGLFESLHIV